MMDLDVCHFNSTNKNKTHHRHPLRFLRFNPIDFPFFNSKIIFPRGGRTGKRRNMMGDGFFFLVFLPEMQDNARDLPQ